MTLVSIILQLVLVVLAALAFVRGNRLPPGPERTDEHVAAWALLILSNFQSVMIALRGLS